VFCGVTAGFLAVLGGLASVGAGAAKAASTGSAPNTWSPLTALPERLDRPLFALGVDPSDAQRVLAGTPTGNLYRSTDGGATWKLVGSRLGHGVLALAFDPFTTGVVLAGTRNGGIWRSGDDGVSWQRDAGSEGRTARAFGFARQLTVAGTDRGVLVNRSGASWTPAGLGQVAVSAVAVATVTDPQRLVVGGDTTRGTEPLPLFGSSDGAQSWQLVEGAVGGSSMISALAAGPMGAGSGTGSLLMGTNTGLYSSADNGADWQAVTGSGGLPAADYTAVAFVASDPQRIYVASDGGASPQGGLWSTADGGTHFTSLSPPIASVTALAVSAETQPVVYVATFRPIDHAVMLWAYRDTGGAAQQPVGGVPSPAGNGGATSQAQAKPQAGPGGPTWLIALVRGPEGPYLVLGLAAAVVLVLALVAYARRTRSL
jgi:photosystem II stability/assembly factor-like uncharacterized protein